MDTIKTEAKEWECASCNQTLSDKVGERTTNNLREVDDDGNAICDYCYVMEFEESRDKVAQGYQKAVAEFMAVVKAKCAK